VAWHAQQITKGN